MEIKPKTRGWSEGIMKEDLRSVGGTTHKKGSIVRYRKIKVLDENNCYTSEYEYHYVDQSNYNLVRGGEILLAEPLKKKISKRG